MTIDRLTIDVEWFRPAFHGLAGGRVDWPPSPVRLLGAFMSGAYALDDLTCRRALSVLQYCTEQPNPVIDVPDSYALDLPDTFTQRSWHPHGALKHKDAKTIVDLSVLGMDSSSRAAKPVTGYSLIEPVVRYHLSGSFADSDIDVLRAAAAGIGYFGRSNDPAIVSVRYEDEARLPGSLSRLRPTSRSTGGTRGWKSNTVEWFETNHRRLFGPGSGDGNVPPPLPAHGYVEPLTYLPGAGGGGGGYEPLVFERAVPSHLVADVMRHLAKFDERIFPIIDAGSRHSDGQCIGVGILMDGRADHLDSRSALAAAISDESIGKWSVGVRVGAGERSGDPGSWLRVRRFSNCGTRWMAATPLRGFPDERVVGYQLADELSSRYGVALIGLTAHREPVWPWHKRWATAGFQDGFRCWWPELELSEPISGPLSLGASRSEGFGLFIPQDRATGEGGQDGGKG